MTADNVLYDLIDDFLYDLIYDETVDQAPFGVAVDHAPSGVAVDQAPSGVVASAMAVVNMAFYVLIDFFVFEKGLISEENHYF